jgi:NitT/TauT family transport system substrate-binding protein
VRYFFPVLFLLLSANQCGLYEARALPPTKEKVVVAQFGKEKFLLYLPFYIAMEEGMFKKRGLEIDLRFAGNDDQIFATVMSGDAMFGLGDPVFAAISREKGGPGKVVAMMVTKLGLSGYTNKESVPNIDKPEKAKGLRIGSFPAPSTTFTLLTEFIKNNGLDKAGTKIVPAAIGGQLAALEAGAVDIAVDLEPSVSIAESKGYRVNFLFDQFTQPQAITGITTLDETIKMKPPIIEALVTGLQEAMIKLKSDQEMPYRVAKKLFPNLSDDVIKNAVRRMMGAGVYPFFVKVDDELWQRTLKTRLDSGELKRTQPTHYSVNNNFADHAMKELGLDNF